VDTAEKECRALPAGGPEVSPDMNSNVIARSVSDKAISGVEHRRNQEIASPDESGSQ